jgi:NAD(P)H-hydrate epimerase
VHVVAPADTVRALIAAEPDLQTLPHPLEGNLTAELQALLSRADSLAIGPGLGRSAGRLDFVLAAVRLVQRVVIDADALQALAVASKPLLALCRERQVLLTPHPGEFRTLFPAQAGAMELDPWGAAAAASADSGATVLLKGVPSVVARDGQTRYTIAAGNPGLGTGGSGDLLSGITGTLLAQGLESDVAGALGAQILGRAADLAARRTTARGLRPMDVVAALPDLWRAWETLRRVGPAPRPPVLFELERPQVW